jgi:acylphosphatase
VKNRPDGTVEIRVAGQVVVMEEFMAELARGPKDSNVTAVRTLSAGDITVDTVSLPYPFQILRQAPA